ncbi:hypothetical protein [Ramlibacter aurantiacus]|nr:hypothetical protein [Ramlibacter aurantiacus]
MERPSFSRVLLQSCAPAIVWALHFVLIYGFAGVVCARPQADWRWWGVPATTWGVAAAGVLALALIAWSTARAWPRRNEAGDSGFVAAFTLGVALLSAVGVVWETAVVWLVPSCV